MRKQDKRTVFSHHFGKAAQEGQHRLSTLLHNLWRNMLQGDLAYQAMGKYDRVVPTIDIQGSAGPVVWLVNGDQVIQQWMQTDYDASGGTYNASFSNPATTAYGQVPPGGHSYTTCTWNNKSGQEIEEYWVVNGMGHAWSGGSGLWGDPAGPSANLALYNFFLRFSN